MSTHAEEKKAMILRLIKFAIVGGSGVVVNMVVFQIALFALAESITSDDGRVFAANLVGVVVSIFTNFLLNDRWTWGDRSKGKRWQDWGRRLGRYYVSAAAAAGVQLGVTSVSFALVFDRVDVHILGVIELGPSLGLLTGIACGMVINFAASHLWAFREEES